MQPITRSTFIYIHFNGIQMLFFVYKMDFSIVQIFCFFSSFFLQLWQRAAIEYVSQVLEMQTNVPNCAVQKWFFFLVHFSFNFFRCLLFVRVFDLIDAFPSKYQKNWRKITHIRIEIGWFIFLPIYLEKKICFFEILNHFSYECFCVCSSFIRHSIWFTSFSDWNRDNGRFFSLQIYCHSGVDAYERFGILVFSFKSSRFYLFTRSIISNQLRIKSI